MKKKFFTLAFVLILSANAISQVADAILRYETANDMPDSNSMVLIQQWISNHQQVKNTPILLCGHTDAHADSAFNNSLSERRSLNVKRILHNAGFEQVETRFYGESWPICQGQGELCDYQNRRVEVLLGDTEEEKFRMKQDVEVPQVLFFNPCEPLKFTGNKGTEVNMAANSLCADGKPVTGEVRCELHEYYSRKDIINARMNTMHNDKILETGGMIEIRMFQGNEELKLCGDARVDLVFATQKKKPESDMQLFNGEIKNGQMNWQLQDPVFDKSYAVRIMTDAVANREEVVWESQVITAEYKIFEFVPRTDSAFLQLQAEAEKNFKEATRKLTENDKIAHSFGLKSLGYANCDAMRDIGPLMEMDIESVEESNGTYLIVLENRDIYLNPWLYYGNNKKSIHFHAVPVNEPISVIYLEKTEKGNRFARLHGTARQVESAKLDVKLLTDKELEKAMAEL